MDKYKALMELQNNLEENLKTLEEQEDLSAVEEEVIKTLENRIEQVKRYAKLVQFSIDLNKLYKARMESKDPDEAREIEVDMKYLLQGNEHYFSARYRNDIAKLDKEFYKEIKEKYGVSLISPERFMKELEEGKYIDDEGRVQQVQVNENLLKIVDTRAASLNNEEVIKEVVEDLNEDLELIKDPKEEVVENKLEWDPRLTEEQRLEALSRDIYEPVGQEYEQFLNELGLTPLEESKEEKPEWDPRLTEEQRLEALSRDIYEPVGQEYEQFLNELGLSPLEETEEKAVENNQPTEEVAQKVEEEKNQEVEQEDNTVVNNNQPQFREEVIVKELPEDKQQTLFYGTIGDGHLDPVAQFEKELNTKFDPDRYEVIYDHDDNSPNIPYRIVEKYEKETRIVPVLNNQFLLEDKQMGKQPLGIEDKHQGQLLLEDKQMNKVMNEITVEDPVIIYGGQKKEDEELKTVIEGENGNQGTTAEVGSEEIQDRSFNIDVQGRSLETILREITLDKDGETLDLTPKERKKITKGKISVTKNMKSRVQHENWVYNVLGVTSALIPAVVQAITKLTNKAYTALHPNVKANHDQIIENLYKLSDEDLEVLKNELTNNKATELRSFAAILPLVYERLQVYIEERYNEPIRERITQLELELHEMYKRVFELDRSKSEVSEEEQRRIAEEMRAITAGGAEKVYEVMALKNQLARNIEGGPGAHTFAEGSKAVDNHMNDKGYAFARRKGLEESEEFNKQNAIYADDIKKALKDGDDLAAVYTYVSKEIYDFKHTREQATLAGRVESGEYKWKAMPESLNYGIDPLVSYLMTTISTITLAKGIMSEIHNMQLKNQIEEANKHNAQQLVDINGRNASNQQANLHNQETMDQIRQTGKELEAKSDDYVQGINQMSKDSVVSNRTAGEYNAGDATNWSFNSEYHTLDHASHEQVHELYDHANQGFEQIQQGVQNGTLDPVQAIQEAQGILTQMNTAKHATYQQFLETMSKYTAEHPNIDYVPLENYMNNIVNNQDAINAMVDGMTQSVQAGHTLQEAVIELYSPIIADIQGIPADIQSLIAPLITQAALTGYLNRMNINCEKKLQGKGHNADIEYSLCEVIEQTEGTREITEDEDLGRSR